MSISCALPGAAVRSRTSEAISADQPADDCHGSGRRWSCRASLLLWGVVLPVAAGPATAAEPTSNRSTPATLKITSTYTPGQFESENDSEWYKVKLTAGTDYAISGESRGGYGINLFLRDAKGKLLPPRFLSDGYTDAGFEFRPKKTGTYFVEAKPVPGYNLTYNIRVAPDCREGRTTKCVLKLGVEQSRVIAWSFDVDWMKVTLRQDRSYRLETTGEAGIRNADGSPADLIRSGDSFRPKTSGTYYVVISASQDTGYSYKVKLVSP